DDYNNHKTAAERLSKTPPSGRRVARTWTWDYEVKEALKRFAKLYPVYPAGNSLDVIQANLRSDLDLIGYFLGVPAGAGPSDTAKVFHAAVQAFRTHFFSGPRRTYFGAKVDKKSTEHYI